jgi:hypothetical protein
MNPRRYFSRESAHGSETSHGFANDTIVYAFACVTWRDKYVQESRNLSCRAIRASEATKEATNVSLTDNHNGKPRAFTIECWVIREPYDPERVPAGCIGSLEIGSTWDDGIGLQRFYR